MLCDFDRVPRTFVDAIPVDVSFGCTAKVFSDFMQNRQTRMQCAPPKEHKSSMQAESGVNAYIRLFRGRYK